MAVQPFACLNLRIQPSRQRRGVIEHLDPAIQPRTASFTAVLICAARSSTSRWHSAIPAGPRFSCRHSDSRPSSIGIRVANPRGSLTSTYAPISPGPSAPRCICTGVSQGTLAAYIAALPTLEALVLNGLLIFNATPSSNARRSCRMAQVGETRTSRGSSDVPMYICTSRCRPHPLSAHDLHECRNCRHLGAIRRFDSLRAAIQKP